MGPITRFFRVRKGSAREEPLKRSRNSGIGSGTAVAVLLLLLLVAGGVFYAMKRSPAVEGAFHSVKESAQDAATTSRVRTALLLSKHVSPFDIKVESSKGTVVLSGQVPSEELKSMAGAIAQDTSGVNEVQNNIAINPAAVRDPEMDRLRGRVADLEIKTIISDSLSKKPELKEKQIDAQVKDGLVTLFGTVEAAPQKYSAEQVAWQAPGVRGVMDNLTVTNAQAAPESADENLAHRVEFELYSTKAISLKTMHIQAQNGTVTLTGTVASRAEKLLAEKVAHSVEGVRNVANDLVAPEEMQP
jgi:hyperosmotically inducible protein